MSLGSLLDRLLPHEDIHVDGDLYIRRYQVTGAGGRFPSLFGCNVFVDVSRRTAPVGYSVFR